MTTTRSPIGRSDVMCADCEWHLPPGIYYYDGHQKSSGRPANADYVDATMPKIRAHGDSTGHSVRVATTTFHAARDPEVSALVLRVLQWPAPRRDPVASIPRLDPSDRPDSEEVRRERELASRGRWNRSRR